MIDQVKAEGRFDRRHCGNDRRRRAGRSGQPCQWDRKLDGRIAQAVVSINAFKGCEIGIGFEAGRLSAVSQVHDEIMYSKERGYYREQRTVLGGFEGGMTNGEQIVVRGVMKPIPTLVQTAGQRRYRHEGAVHGAGRTFGQLCRTGSERRDGACRCLGSSEGVSGEVRRRLHGGNPREPKNYLKQVERIEDEGADSRSGRTLISDLIGEGLLTEQLADFFRTTWIQQEVPAADHYG